LNGWRRNARVESVNCRGALEARGQAKRTFTKTRSAGHPAWPTGALPILQVAAVSIVVGLAAAALYLHSQVGIAFRVPGIAYWLTVLGGLAASLAIIASMFPLLNRITGPEVARNE
jgi:hypothetical protein